MWRIKSNKRKQFQIKCDLQFKQIYFTMWWDFFVWFDCLRSINNLSVKQVPVFLGLNQYQARINVSSSNPQPLGLESSTLPLHSLNVMRCVKETNRIANSIAPEGASDLGVCCFLWHSCLNILCTVKLVLSNHSKIDKTKILMTNGSLMKVLLEHSAILLTCIKW